MCMTEREEFMEIQRFAEEHHSLLLAFMRRHGLSDDYYGPLAERYMKATRAYLQRKDLQEFSFSTIVWHHLQAETIKIRQQAAKAPKSCSCDNMLYPPSCRDDLGANLLWYEIEQRVTEQQLDILRLRAIGFTNAEIAKKYKCTAAAISGKVRKVKALLKKQGVF